MNAALQCRRGAAPCLMWTSSHYVNLCFSCAVPARPSFMARARRSGRAGCIDALQRGHHGRSNGWMYRQCRMHGQRRCLKGGWPPATVCVILPYTVYKDILAYMKHEEGGAMRRALIAVLSMAVAFVMFASSVWADEPAGQSDLPRGRSHGNTYGGILRGAHEKKTAPRYMVGAALTCRRYEDGSTRCNGMGRAQIRPPGTPDNAVFVCDGRGRYSRCLRRTPRPIRELGEEAQNAWRQATSTIDEMQSNDYVGDDAEEHLVNHACRTNESGATICTSWGRVIVIDSPNVRVDDEEEEDEPPESGGRVRECVDRTERLPSGLTREWRDCSAGAVAVTIE